MSETTGYIILIIIISIIITLIFSWKDLEKAFEAKAWLKAEIAKKAKEEEYAKAKAKEYDAKHEAEKAKLEEEKLEEETQLKQFVATANYKYVKNFVSINKICLNKYSVEPVLSNSVSPEGSKYSMFITGADGNIHVDSYYYRYNPDDFERDKKNISEISGEFSKLKNLMFAKHVDFSENRWICLIEKEVKRQNIEELKTKILYNSPETSEEYIRNFVEIYGENYLLYLDTFKTLLKGKRLGVSQINERINRFIKKMELERFKKKLESGGSNSITMQDIDSMSGHEFESFLKTLFEKQGYKVELTKLSNDQGADLIVSKFGEKVVLQAKRYSTKVSNGAIQEAVAAIKHYVVDRGIVITNSEFTRSAIELAKSNNIELIDRDKLEKLIREFL